MKTYKKIHGLIAAYLALIALCCVSCEKPPTNEYTGPNNIRVTSSDKTLSPQRKETLTITLERSVNKETQAVNISVDNDPLGAIVVPKQIKFVDTARSVSFEAKLNSNVAITEMLFPILRFSLQPSNDTTSLMLTVKNAKPLSKYTGEQEEIFNHWIAKGIPLDKILDRDLPVEVTVSWPNDGLVVPFCNAGNEHYEGLTVLTLSTLATRDSLVLKFHENALGMTPFFYFAHRKLTVENDEFWYGEYSGPLFAKVMKLINWNKTSQETFDCTLDSVAIAPKGPNGISPVNTMYDNVRDGDLKFRTPFDFSYTAWDRLKQKIEEGNADALEIEPTDASSWPHRRLNRCDFHYSEDRTRTPPYVNEYDEVTPMPVQSAHIDWNTGKLHFDLYTDFDGCGSYVQFKGSVQLLPKP